MLHLTKYISGTVRQVEYQSFWVCRHSGDALPASQFLNDKNKRQVIKQRSCLAFHFIPSEKQAVKYSHTDINQKLDSSKKKVDQINLNLGKAPAEVFLTAGTQSEVLLITWRRTLLWCCSNTRDIWDRWKLFSLFTPLLLFMFDTSNSVFLFYIWTVCLYDWITRPKGKGYDKNHDKKLNQVYKKNILNNPKDQMQIVYRRISSQGTIIWDHS